MSADTILRRQLDEAGESIARQARTIREQDSEIERLRADAERYRWLRANRQFCAAAYPDGEWAIPAGMVFLGPDNLDADAWIDAARGKEA